MRAPVKIDTPLHFVSAPLDRATDTSESFDCECLLHEEGWRGGVYQFTNELLTTHNVTLPGSFSVTHPNKIPRPCGRGIAIV